MHSNSNSIYLYAIKKVLQSSCGRVKTKNIIKINKVISKNIYNKIWKPKNIFLKSRIFSVNSFNYQQNYLQ